MCEFVVENNIHTDIELFTKAKEQKEASKKELTNFLVSRSSKSLQENGMHGRWNPQQQHWHVKPLPGWRL